MRHYEEITISYIENLIPEVPPLRGPHQSNYYRGQADQSWALNPALFRTGLERTGFSSWLEIANSNHLKFKQFAPPDLRVHMTSELEWTATACHHFAPTNFSAWSEAALVGLYFATEETQDKADGALWRLMPGTDNMTIFQDYEQVPDAPRFYHPQYQTPEMAAQRVCFLTHPFPDANTPPVSFENYYNTSDDLLNLCKITIPHEDKREIRRQIAALGFDSRNIFPGLKGIGRQISEELYSHSESYNWIM
ncbi:MAG: FRG domain-containing protein [Verrucomicrobiales bacterium]|nr:FRG domain-containing protein [Verrucomicrobiales bacterium]